VTTTRARKRSRAGDVSEVTVYSAVSRPIRYRDGSRWVRIVRMSLTPTLDSEPMGKGPCLPGRVVWDDADAGSFEDWMISCRASDLGGLDRDEVAMGVVVPGGDAPSALAWLLEGEASE
jgi:hypothetical protein